MIGRIKKALFISMAAMMLCTPYVTQTDNRVTHSDNRVTHSGNALNNELFIFPQFASAAASDRKGGSDSSDGSITYSFKIAEILKNFFKEKSF